MLRSIVSYVSDLVIPLNHPPSKKIDSLDRFSSKVHRNQSSCMSSCFPLSLFLRICQFLLVQILRDGFLWFIQERGRWIHADHRRGGRFANRGVPFPIRIRRRAVQSYTLCSRTGWPIVIIPSFGIQITGGRPPYNVVSHCVLHLRVQETVKQRYEQALLKNINESYYRMVETRMGCMREVKWSDLNSVISGANTRFCVHKAFKYLHNVTIESKAMHEKPSICFCLYGIVAST